MPLAKTPLTLTGGLLLAVLGWIAALGSASTAHAQYLVGIKLNKTSFLTFEGVEATVTISNRSGSDIVMGGPSGDSWLAFDITDPKGNQVPPLRVRGDEAIVFKSGATISRVVPLSDFYSFSEYGNYGIIASIYHPPTQQYFASNRERAFFTDAKPFKELSFGVPTGLPGAGEVHVYSLTMLRGESEHTYLYIRITEEKTKLKLATFSLGTIVLVADPQLTLDRDNRLHILFMTVPHVYSHVCVDTQGNVVKRLYYKEVETNRPHLAVGAGEEITVQGGEPYDPNAPVIKPPGRSVGKRPPGL